LQYEPAQPQPIPPQFTAVEQGPEDLPHGKSGLAARAQKLPGQALDVQPVPPQPMDEHEPEDLPHGNELLAAFTQ
jgi:hypothetical protein